MCSKLVIPVFVLVATMAAFESNIRAEDGTTPTSAQVQESSKKAVKHIDAKTASECYHACKQLAEFDSSGSKPSKPAMAFSKKAELRWKAAKYCPQVKETGSCDMQCPYCVEAMTASK